MDRPSMMDHLRYRFDAVMAKGTVALIGLLGLATVTLLGAAAAVMTIAGMAPAEAEPGGFAENFWFGMMRTLDAGTMGGDEGSWPFKLTMLGVTMGGIFIVSMLIGVLTSGVEAKVEDLRKGRSRVIEKDHTVILGWSPQVFTFIGELVQANESKKGAAIVVLGDADKVEMEEELRARIPDLRGSWIVCRSGNPSDLTDLAMASVQTCRSILITAPEGDEDPDVTVIKSLLAITNAPDRREEPYHIVAVVQQQENLEAAKLVGKDEVEVILAGDLISRITVQTCRQAGLSVVHTELLDFGGDEIYFKHEPSLAGKTFGDALFAYEGCSLLGLRTVDGKVQVHPKLETVIGPKDKIIAIAEDDDKILLGGKVAPIDESAIRTGTPTPPQPERALILGWNWRSPLLVTGLDAYVAPDSEVTVICETDEATVREACGALKNQSLVWRHGDSTSRKLLDTLGVGDFDHIIIVCSDGLDPQKADARVLMTLLHLRDMQEKSGQHFSIVTEMLDVRNRELAEVTKADDFIVSERLVSLMMTQIAENKELAAVLNDLFDPDGSEIYLKPANDYVEAGKFVSYATVVEAARRRGEIAIGYRLASLAHDAEHAYGVKVNPAKSTMLVLGPTDKVVVVAES